MLSPSFSFSRFGLSMALLNVYRSIHMQLEKHKKGNVRKITGAFRVFKKRERKNLERAKERKLS